MTSYLDNFSKSFLEKKCKELEDKLEKSKIYVQPGDKVPEGATIITGEREGKYYESGKTSSKLSPSHHASGGGEVTNSADNYDYLKSTIGKKE